MPVYDVGAYVVLLLGARVWYAVWVFPKVSNICCDQFLCHLSITSGQFLLRFSFSILVFFAISGKSL